MPRCCALTNGNARHRESTSHQWPDERSLDVFRRVPKRPGFAAAPCAQVRRRRRYTFRMVERCEQLVLMKRAFAPIHKRLAGPSNVDSSVHASGHRGLSALTVK
jgi:hypothetical protein